MAMMKIVMTGAEGIPGSVGLEFGRGFASDDDGHEDEIFNPGACPVAPSTSVVVGRVHISRWAGEAWCVLAVGCLVNHDGKTASTPRSTDPS